MSGKNNPATENNNQEPSFSHPKYWPTWCLIWLMKFLAKRSHSTLIKLGYWLGGIGYALVKRRRVIAEKNIALCFPELSPDEQKQLVKQTMNENMIGLLETLWAWYGDTSDLQERLTIEGKEHIESAIAKGRGVLLVGAHYTTLDLGNVMINPVTPIYATYAPNKNALLDRFIYEGRIKNLVGTGAIPKGDMRGFVRALKSGGVLWYAPDQDYGRRHSVFAPFFGIDAATVKMTAKLASLNESPVVVVSHHREPDDAHYRLRFRPALENFPTGDEEADAARINQAIEDEIRICPSQYMWVHRRFKSRPKGEPSLY